MTDNDKAVKNETVKKAHCSQCGGSRNCDIRGNHDDVHHYDHISEGTAWYLLQCRGCEHVFVQTVYTNSEDVDQSYGPDGETVTEYVERIQYWPALAKRQWPEWMTAAGIDADDADELNDSLLELYGALNNDLHMLAAIGIRTSFDKAAEILKIDPDWPFQRKLTELVKRGHIGEVDKSQLEVLVDAGSASAHRGWKPTAEHLNTMMDALEHFVHEAFVNPKKKLRLQDKITKMKKTVPPRKARERAKA